MLFSSIINLFKQGNVCVSGMRGTGKDILFGNVIARRKMPYVSNVDYTNGKNFNLLDFNNLDMGRNTYKNFINNDFNFYEYPYPTGSDIYLSDAGVYLPAQYCNELNKEYKYLPAYFALSRQVSHNNFHVNVQSLNRVYDKIREQSDIYIKCNSCVVLFGFLVIQDITIYDKYESCLNRVKPCKISVPLLADKNVKMSAEQYLDNFYNTHGSVKRRLLIYINKSKHDTYLFEKLLKGGKKSC